MNKNGIETSLFTIGMKNIPGALDKFLGLIKNLNIVGLQLVNTPTLGHVQLVVEPQFVAPMTEILNREGILYTTTSVYGVYLNHAPDALRTSIIGPLSLLGVSITNIFTAVGTPRVFVGLDNVEKGLPVLEAITVPEVKELVTA